MFKTILAFNTGQFVSPFLNRRVPHGSPYLLSEVGVRWLCRCPGIERKPTRNELTRNSSGNTRPQSFQLAEPLWTDPGQRSGISVCDLISTLKKKKRRRGMNCQAFFPNPRKRGKSHRLSPPPPGSSVPASADR